MNVLRLPVSWSAFEPQQGQFQTAYLDAITAFLNEVRPYGFYVLLDFHEDGWSKDLCEDGAPAWATVVTVSEEGGAPGGDCHTSNAALSAHSNFFDENVNDLQGDFATMYQQFAAHFVNEDLVFGYEIFNEPIASDPVVDAFSIKLAQAIRQVDTRHLILWEPSSLRNQLNESLISSTPFPVSGGVYAVHVYTTAPYTIPSSILSAQTEAEAWGEPLFVTEHGANPLEDGGIAGLTTRSTGSTRRSRRRWTGSGIRASSRTTMLGRSTSSTKGESSSTSRARTRWPSAATSRRRPGTAPSSTITFQDHSGVPTQHDIYWNRGNPSVTCDGASLSGVTGNPTTLVFTVSCGAGLTAGDASPVHTLVFSSP